MCQEQVSHGAAAPRSRSKRSNETLIPITWLLILRITRAFLIEEANIVKRVLKAQAVAPKKK